MSYKNKKLFVGNLSTKITEEELKEKFGAFGKIADFNLVKKDGSDGCYAFIGFEDEQDAEDAKSKLDQTSLLSRDMRIEFSKGKDRGNFRSGGGAYDRNQGGRGRFDNNNGDRGAPRKCYNCNELGHIARDCGQPNRNGDRRQRSRSPRKERRERSPRRDRERRDKSPHGKHRRDRSKSDDRKKSRKESR